MQKHSDSVPGLTSGDSWRLPPRQEAQTPIYRDWIERGRSGLHVCDMRWARGINDPQSRGGTRQWVGSRGVEGLSKVERSVWYAKEAGDEKETNSAEVKESKKRTGVLEVAWGPCHVIDKRPWPHMSWRGSNIFLTWTIDPVRFIHHTTCLKNRRLSGR